MTSPKAPDKFEWDHAGQIQLIPPEPFHKPVPELFQEPEGNCTKAWDISGQVIVDDEGL